MPGALIDALTMEQLEEMAHGARSRVEFNGGVPVPYDLAHSIMDLANVTATLIRRVHALEEYRDNHIAAHASAC